MAITPNWTKFCRSDHSPKQMHLYYKYISQPNSFYRALYWDRIYILRPLSEKETDIWPYDAPSPYLLGLLFLLQTYEKVGAAESVEKANRDERWQMVLATCDQKLDLSREKLDEFRGKLMESGLGKTLSDRTCEQCYENPSEVQRKLKEGMEYLAQKHSPAVAPRHDSSRAGHVASILRQLVNDYARHHSLEPASFQAEVAGFFQRDGWPVEDFPGLFWEHFGEILPPKMGFPVAQTTEKGTSGKFWFWGSGTGDPKTGEDAFPITASPAKDFHFAAVADGLGGYAGAKTAAETVLKGAGQYFQSRYSPSSSLEDTASRLTLALQEKLQEVAGENGSASRLRGTLAETQFASTLVLATVETARGKPVVRVFWIGDSRAYFLSRQGFYLLTCDDVEGPFDALHSFYHDLPMSQYLAARKSSKMQCRIHAREYVFAEPGVVILCTDGCTKCWLPWVLEEKLRSTMRQAIGWESWMRAMRAAVEKDKSDDYSLAAIPSEGPDKTFEQLRLKITGSFGKRSAHQALGLAPGNGSHKERVEEAWKKYKTSHEYYVQAGVHPDRQKNPIENAGSGSMKRLPFRETTGGPTLTGPGPLKPAHVPGNQEIRQDNPHLP